MVWTLDTQGPITVDVDIAAGSVHMIAGDRSETVVTVNPANPESERDVEAARTARVELSDARLSVVVPKPGGIMAYISFRDWGLVDVTIELPEGSSVDARTGAGDFRADGEFGEVRAKSGAGAVQVDRAQAVTLVSGAGRLRLGSSRGDTELVTAGDMEIGTIDGTAEVKNLNGRIRIGEVTGSIRVRSSNGDIDVGSTHGEVAVRTASGDISIGEVNGGSITLATGSGGLEIGIAAGITAWIDARTKFGGVRNSLEATDQPPTEEGVVEVRARTSFGDIDVFRAGTREEVQ